ncbi:hypothetical protein BAMY_03230 [Bacillus amyloliquefaciens]|jgi:hypothetical protein|uniref:Fur-regulated basic protein FbpA n=2 Tax=Bacillus amyloliquefaciens group TaxID=1938374 RepID=I2C250_BACAY|nr:conserved hypothetical protein YebD [Bacillus velezensis YAU B9601-Y2]AKL75269.1 hypothetical protein ABH13_0667 [Bacillus velezensis]ALV03946.1 hypothetical protein AVM03_16995 [Bacillus amyloliquefaciens]EIF12193.1 hypothetical protein MY7_0495 [Bacillus sp. 5B6]ERK81500.1 hypothetical protein N786_19110 [Bacillus amyloliquefaciens UASWS BA1]KMN52098.1 hypothetical protein VK94_19865 [Bacillus sp. LK7]CCF04185.1 YebD [Bacillus velezensis CAU B946]GFR57131.1 YebD [Bacillus sp. CN2]
MIRKGMMKMAPLLREAINRKKQHLRTKLIRSGFYQDHVQELSGYTLSELEKEYEAVKRLKKAELH